MKWKKHGDKDGNIIQRVLISDSGYKISRFSEAGADQYRASIGNAFIGVPTDREGAKSLCENHHKLMGNKKADIQDDD